MYILAIHSGGHDACAALYHGYEIRAATQHERMVRHKGAGGFPTEAIEEVLATEGIDRTQVGAIVLSRSNVARRHVKFHGHHRFANWWSRVIQKKSTVSLGRVMRNMGVRDARHIFNHAAFLEEHGFPQDIPVYFFNHHLAHALSALFFTPWQDALVYTGDAAGDNVQYSAYRLKDGALTCLFGGEENLSRKQQFDSVARAYAYATEAIGFKSFRHEGKLTGLAAFGKPILAEQMKALFSVSPNGKINGHFKDNDALKARIFAISNGQDKADVAASVQKMLEDLVLASLQTILAQHSSKRLGVAGGIFANVRLNALLKDSLGLEEIFICPAMGDEGMVIGGPLCYLLERDGVAEWLKQRYRLSHMYYGRDYTKAVEPVFTQHPRITIERGDVVAQAAEALAKGEAGAIYTGRMEYGPRALGTRSILASPAQRDINDNLNKRLARTEFMPFAPYVREEDAREVFGVDDANAYACRFMTITTPVADAWKDKIPAVVHVDGTARPQIIRREENPLYYDILSRFKELTGLPVLVNTSFNAHEEPIINTPEECLRALLDSRVDFIVTESAIYREKSE